MLVNLAALTSMRTVLTDTMTQLTAARTKVDGVTGHGRLLPPLRSAAATFSHQITQLDAELLPLQRSMTLAPELLGFNGKRTYLLAVQNPAEARGTGGLIAAYSLVTAESGKLTVLRSGTNLDFPHQISPGQTYSDLEAGGSTAAKATSTFFAANALPDWARTGATLAALSDATFHTHLDGVIGLTPAGDGPHPDGDRSGHHENRPGDHRPQCRLFRAGGRIRRHPFHRRAESGGR